MEVWIKEGYQILALDGFEGIKIERLARTLHLNKSGFYHYFGRMKTYVDSLLEYHIRGANKIARDIQRCKSIDPDLLKLIVRHRTFFLVESHLLVKSIPTHGAKNFGEAGKIIIEQFLKLWKKETTVPEDSDVARRYLDILRHFFYARINPTNINYEFLHQLAVETKDVLNLVIEEKQLSKA